MIFDLLWWAYWIVLAFVCGYAWLAGERPERAGAAIMAAASILSWCFATAEATLWRSPDIGILAVDVASVLALLPIALRSDRYWPLWITVFQIAGIAMHVGMKVEPDSLPRVYAILQGFWAYPGLIALAIGTYGVAKERRLASAPSSSR